MSNVIPLRPETIMEDEGFQTVELDITLMSNDLYDQILRELHIQHGNGIYIEWKITATKGTV
jgi:hypothetical protein